MSSSIDAKRITIISGGTASNSLVAIFASLSPHISYLLPISDNGGSTSELIRVVGGPAIGDLRSRITRLIPEKSESLRALLSYRLSEDPLAAKSEWTAIVEGTHHLWLHVQSQCKELIRPFFIHVHVELLKKSRPGREFRFEKANVGNLFLTGARLFCGSLDSAIELFLRITLVPSTLAVLPALNTNFSHHISAQLENGEVITGQSQISHPSANHLTPVKEVPYANIPKTATGGSISLENNQLRSKLHDVTLSEDYWDSSPASTSPIAPIPALAEGAANPQHQHPLLRLQPVSNDSSSALSISVPPRNSITSANNSVVNSSTHSSPDQDQEDAHLPFSHPDLKISQLHYAKGENIPLVSPIRRIFYINPYGQEIHPRASSRVIRTLEESDVVIYSIGSLFTSTIPVVILQGFASSIQDNAHLKKKKILLLNGSKDRETDTMDALGFVRALVGACLYSELGGKSSIYNNFNYSSSNLSLNLLSKQAQHQAAQQKPRRDFAASNFTTTSAHPQDILMRPTPRLTKAYNPGNTSLGPDYDNSTSGSSFDSGSWGYPGGGHRGSIHGLFSTGASANSSSANLMYASDHDIDDVYNADKIDKTSWLKYITHIVYLKDSPLCPTSDALREFHARGIKCYELMSVKSHVDKIKNDNADVYKYDSEQLRQLLLDLINE